MLRTMCDAANAQRPPLFNTTGYFHVTTCGDSYGDVCNIAQGVVHAILSGARLE